jgi:hypothetical protein
MQTSETAATSLRRQQLAKAGMLIAHERGGRSRPDFASAQRGYGNALDGPMITARRCRARRRACVATVAVFAGLVGMVLALGLLEGAAVASSGSERPAALVLSSGEQRVFYRAANAANGATGDPAAFLQPNGNQNVFFRGTDASIKTYVYRAATNTWEFYDLGGHGGAGLAAGDPAAFLQPNGNQNVFFRGTDASIKTYVYRAATNTWEFYALPSAA